MDIDITRSQLPHERPKLLIASITLSLALHLAVVLILPLFVDQEQPPLSDRKTTVVRLVEPEKKPEVLKPEQEPESPQESLYEIDQQPLLPIPSEPVESRRKADQDQSVPQEMAPDGRDDRDQVRLPAPAPVPQPAQPKPSQPAAPEKKPAKQSDSVKPEKPVEKTIPRQQLKPTVNNQTAEKKAQRATIKEQKEIQTRPLEPSVPTTAQPQHPPPAPPVLLLTPDQLMPDRQSLDRLLSAKYGARDKIKQRDDIEIGDTIWLNLQHDLLVSFFRRFHNQVEQVWNYPVEAAEQGIGGTLLLKIIVDRQGELIDVDRVKSSGSDLLDFEAIQAIYRAAPFGPLTKHYPHEQLKIMAHFQYINNAGKYIYGERRSRPAGRPF